MKYEIGNRIRKYREELGISQKALAEQIGVSNGRVSNWEQGLNRPDADMLAELCVALNVSPSSLLGVKISKDELSDIEWKIIQAYREKKDLQKAVRILLGVCKE
ncbi:MAG: helix-turn-helix transcriptional regulator [Lachnospiraceae bacterium]|nr:helix-turn-helix transcriptional regulator [Lachnospiraceae bacterium]